MLALHSPLCSLGAAFCPQCSDGSKKSWGLSAGSACFLLVRTRVHVGGKPEVSSMDFHFSPQLNATQIKHGKVTHKAGTVVKTRQGEHFN